MGTFSQMWRHLQNIRRAKFASLIVLFVFGISHLALSDEVGGPSLVRLRVPLVYNAFRETIGVERTEQFFENFSHQEVTHLLDRLSTYFEQIIANVAEPDFAQRLYFTWRNHVVGTFGEVYGYARLRTSLPSGTFLLNDSVFQSLNAQGNGSRGRMDGIIYSVDGSTIVIQGLIESKIGTSRFSRSQLERFILAIQKNGITVTQGHFDPERIAIQTIGRISLDAATIPQIESITVLICSQEINRDFEGSHIIFPIDASELQEITSRLSASLDYHLPKSPNFFA